ncbi:MAG: hypothetical protein ACTJFV_05910 [Moraxellaceae bacterium]
MTKIVPDKAQVEDNVNTLARLATLYGTILASDHFLSINCWDRRIFCRFIDKNERIE